MQVDAPACSTGINGSAQQRAVQFAPWTRCTQAETDTGCRVAFFSFSVLLLGELGAASKPQGLRRDGNAGQEREREIAVNAVFIGILRRLRTIALFGLSAPFVPWSLFCWRPDDCDRALFLTLAHHVAVHYPCSPGQDVQFREPSGCAAHGEPGHSDPVHFRDHRGCHSALYRPDPHP